MINRDRCIKLCCTLDLKNMSRKRHKQAEDTGKILGAEAPVSTRR
jgi:hypothetical protein